MKETKVAVVKSDPFIAYIEDLMSVDECDDMISKLEKTQFERSMGFNHDTNESHITDYRTSRTFYDNDRRFVDYNKLIYDTVKHRFWYMPFTVKNIEPVQAQRYGIGDQYKKHCDYFNFASNKKKTDNDRIATVIMYLNDDFEGGETEFHELGIRIKPKKGCALYFEYTYIPELNFKTLHSGNPVTKGEKIIVTSWIRHHEYKGGV